MTGLMNNQEHSVVVVLGAGRSGTSLLMQVMVGLGLSVSNNLISANVSNAKGFFEDLETKDIQSDLYRCLSAPLTLPLPEGWLDTECAKIAKSRLSDVLTKQLQGVSGIFGIKDPRISTFLPLWTRVFNPLRVVPKYILAVREPRSVIASFIRQYNTPGHMAELIWLLRTLESLENTAADCFVAHYEDWFADPQPLAQALLHYTKLDLTFKGNLLEVLASTVKPNLSRANHDPYEIQNPYVNKLYWALKECHGADFDRDRLMSVVKECRQAMEGFKGWYQLAHQANKKLADVQKRLEKVSAEADKVKILEAQIRLLESEKKQNAQWAQQVQKLERQLDQLLSVNLGKS
jgi:hypothetical protein